MRTTTRQHTADKEGGNNPLYLTEAGYAKLKKRLERIKRSLPGLIAETAQAAADGDRSDNAAYQSSKAALRRAHWQVLEIEDELKRASIITAGPDPRGGIKLGSIVTLAVNDTERTFEIVGPRETDPAAGRISQESPLGAALIGKRTGEDIVMSTRQGIVSYHIITVR
jgi:transcription elongation GreA/GreB family factor